MAVKREASLYDRVMLGSVPLSDVPLRDRRTVARAFLQKTDTDKRARGLLLELLQGPVPQARPIGRLVAASRKRNLLLEAWTVTFRQMSTTFLEDRPSFDPKEVAARGEWMSKQLAKMRRIEPDSAAELATAACALAIRVLTLPSGGPAGEALSRVVVALQATCESVDTIALDSVLRATVPFRPRISFIKELAAVSRKALDLMPQLRTRVLREDAEFAMFVFTSIPDRAARGAALAADIRDGADPTISATVLRQFLDGASEESRAIYLDALLSLGLKSGDLPTDLAQAVVDIASSSSAYGGGLATVLATVKSVLDERHADGIADIKRSHDEAMTQANARIEEARQQIEALKKALETSKSTRKEPEQQTEHRTRVASLTPVCLIHQEILLSLRERPDLRLQGFARTLDGALVRQGVSRLGKEGEATSFEPEIHEFARWSPQQEGPVHVVVPGYLLKHPILNVETVLARAIVEVDGNATRD